MKLTAGDWTEIFRAGTYGDKGSYSEADLDEMVGNFNASDQVPIVIGHPATDAPAWGWLSALKRVGQVLQGKVGELHDDFARALDEDKFRNRSVRIARTASGLKLLHLGFLGAVLPEVEGLKQPEFAKEHETAIDFQFDLPADQQKEDEMEKDERIRKLEEDLAAEKAARAEDQKQAAQRQEQTRKADFARFVDEEMVGKGRIAQNKKEEAVAFMASLPTGETADFSVSADGTAKKISTVGWFKDFVKSLPEADFVRDLPKGAPADFSQTTEHKPPVDLAFQV